MDDFIGFHSNQTAKSKKMMFIFFILKRQENAKGESIMHSPGDVGHQDMTVSSPIAMKKYYHSKAYQDRESPCKISWSL
jgi:hypothetical protein